MTPKLIESLVDAAKEVSTTVRICLHQEPSAESSVFVIALPASVELPVKQHYTRAKYYWPIGGHGAILTSGESTTSLKLSVEWPLLVRVPAGTLHRVQATAEVFTFLEYIDGPFLGHSVDRTEVAH